MKHLFPILAITVLSLTATIRGITIGLPSDDRIEASFGSGEKVAEKSGVLAAAIASGAAERSEFRERDTIENFGELAALSPYFDSVRSYNPDEFHTLKVLASMYKRRSPLPGSYAYGNFYFYQMGTLAAAGRMFGILEPHSETYFLTHPSAFAPFYLWLRGGMVFFTLATALLLYAAGTMMHGRMLGFLAAATFTTLPVAALAGKSIKPDMPVTFWTVLALFFAVNLTRKPEWKYYLLCGAAIGAAAATKYTGVLAAAVPFTICCAAGFRDWKKLSGCAAAAAAVFALLTPALFFDFPLWKFDLLGIHSGIAGARPWYEQLWCEGLNYLISPVRNQAGLTGVEFALFTAAALFTLIRLFFRFDVFAAALLAFCAVIFSVTCLGQPHSESYLLPGYAAGALLFFQPFAVFARRVPLLPVAALIFPAAAFCDSMRWDAMCAAENPRLSATRWVNANIPSGTAVGMRRYPVAYRSLILDPEKYDLRNELENGRAAALDADYYIDCSFEWDDRRPEFSGHTPVAGFGPRRDFRINYFYETVAPRITIYRKK
ncbi:MAG: glycosyltransferase family 39 protein [Victivallaceae bacterium]|nr:glycosyltransferase family 39 protein [Victivallaceae bacterium]